MEQATETPNEPQPRNSASLRSSAAPCWASDDGNVQLYHADCLDVLPFLSGIDAVITDPPYGLGSKMQGGTWGAKNKKMMQWDCDTNIGFVLPLLDFAPLVVVWGGNYYPLPPSRGWLSWFKPDAPPTMGNFELAWTNIDQCARQISQSIAATNAERVGHPTQKPIRVMVWTLEAARVPQGATVLDPFMGSGTTGIACIRSGRKFIGIERDAKYFEIAKERIRKELQVGRLF
jgi:site-specific DNA-methyltransferase (adenine-specific)